MATYYGHCSNQECNEEAKLRYSLGIYAGRWCDEHWKTAGYRKEGPEGFNPLDAGESYDEEEF